MVVRFGVSLEEDLLNRFDEKIREKGFSSRSDAIRALIREQLIEEQWREPDADVVGILVLVYDHARRDLTENLTRIQHEHMPATVVSTHIHLDPHHCLEIVVLRGKSGRVREIADRLKSTRAVKHGRLIMTSSGVGIP